MSPYYHAISSSKEFGGSPSDYIEIHNWLDETKQYTGDWSHRALRHHSAGVEWCIERFGHFINIENKEIPVKIIAEKHIIEDCGFIPTPQDWLKSLRENPQKWMLSVKVKNEQILQVK